MSLPYSSSNPALSDEKQKECLDAGKAIKIITGKRYQAKRYHDKKSI
jgi:dihydroxy-acid dehydratase